MNSTKGGGYVALEDLFVYKISVEFGDLGWNVYKQLHWADQKIMGEQFIRAVDSVGANIAEGYGRFHFLDRIKFYYNARGSLLETKHWINLIAKREKINAETHHIITAKIDQMHYELNKFIKTTYQSKTQDHKQ